MHTPPIHYRSGKSGAFCSTLIHGRSTGECPRPTAVLLAGLPIGGDYNRGILYTQSWPQGIGPVFIKPCSRIVPPHSPAMAESYRSYVFPYMCTSSSSSPLLGAAIQATSYPKHPPVAPTPGPIDLELPIMTLTLSVDAAYIFDEVCISFLSLQIQVNNIYTGSDPERTT